MRAARVSLVVFLFLVAQTSIAGQLPVFGARADLVLLLAISAGLASGAEAGAICGFAGGLVIDLLATGPVGLTALVATIVGYTVGATQMGVLRSTRMIPVLTAAAASVGGVVLYALAGEVLGLSTLRLGDLWTVSAVVAVLNAVLCLPAVRLMRWAWTSHRRESFAWR